MNKIGTLLSIAYKKLVVNDMESKKKIEDEIEEQVVSQVEVLLSKKGTSVFIDFSSGDFIIENKSIGVDIMVSVTKQIIIRDFGNGIDNSKFNGNTIDTIKLKAYQYTRDLFEAKSQEIQKNRLELMGEHIDLVPMTKVEAV